MTEDEDRPSEVAGANCPNCDHALDVPINDIWKDSHVKAALKDGRTADDIMVLDCPKCGKWGYWNEGSHFTCRFCKVSFYCCSDDYHGPMGVQKVFTENAVTLADTVTVPTDGYDNETLPRE